MCPQQIVKINDILVKVHPDHAPQISHDGEKWEDLKFDSGDYPKEVTFFQGRLGYASHLRHTKE